MLKRSVEAYITESGREPFSEWFDSLKDQTSKARILNRIKRLSRGGVGDCESVGEGVFELRFFFGSGFRVYFAEYKQSIYLLLCGGDKRTQVKDIQKAKEHWKDFKERNK